MSTKQQNTNKLLKFLFPFWPTKIVRTVIGICLLASLIGISIVLNFFKIKITANITISMAWLPTIIIGWYFGPVIGLLMGATIDSINFLINGGIWFWLYAIQEPTLGLITGILSSSFMLIQQNKNHFLITNIISQIMILGFVLSSIFIVFFYTNPNNPFFNSIINSQGSTSNLIKETNKVLRWVILGVLIFLLCLIEGLVIYKFTKWKRDKNNDSYVYETFLFIICICITSTLIFSFLLGPISSIEYYKFVYNSEPPNLVKFGIIFYLLPRVIKECFKTPAYILVLSLIITATNPIIQSVKNRISNSY